jgi:proteic killer suppression protein
LRILNQVIQIEELRVPPGYHLEALSRDRVGQHSIRVNDQFRIGLTCREGHAYEVEIVDYL